MKIRRNFFIRKSILKSRELTWEVHKAITEVTKRAMKAAENTGPEISTEELNEIWTAFNSLQEADEAVKKIRHLLDRAQFAAKFNIAWGKMDK